MAVGLNQGLADKILSFRAGADEREGGFFSGLSEVSAKLSQTAALSDSELALLNLVMGRALTVSLQLLYGQGGSAQGRIRHLPAAFRPGRRYP